LSQRIGEPLIDYPLPVHPPLPVETGTGHRDEPRRLCRRRESRCPGCVGHSDKRLGVLTRMLGPPRPASPWAEFSPRLGFGFFFIFKFHLIQFNYPLNFQNLNKFVENSEKYKVNFA
jgi:hypothetical protein